MLKPFDNKTGNRFVETGYLAVIGLRDIMCHMAVSPGKEGDRPSETQLHNHYVDDGLHGVTHRVQCNQTLWLPPGVVASCYNFFHLRMAVECGGRGNKQGQQQRVDNQDACPLKYDQTSDTLCRH